jgi:hypothetical protein
MAKTKTLSRYVDYSNYEVLKMDIGKTIYLKLVKLFLVLGLIEKR